MGGGRPRNRPPPLLKGALRPLLPAPCTAPGPEGRAGLGLGGVRGGGVRKGPASAPHPRRAQALRGSAATAASAPLP